MIAQPRPAANGNDVALVPLGLHGEIISVRRQAASLDRYGAAGANFPHGLRRLVTAAGRRGCLARRQTAATARAGHRRITADLRHGAQSAPALSHSHGRRLRLPDGAAGLDGDHHRDSRHGAQPCHHAAAHEPGRHDLCADPGRLHSRQRMVCRPLRCPAHLHAGIVHIHARLLPLRPGGQLCHAGDDARPAGFRRRHDDAGRPADPVAQFSARPAVHRHDLYEPAGLDRAGDRPAGGWRSDDLCLVALDLLHQPSLRLPRHLSRLALRRGGPARQSGSFRFPRLSHGRARRGPAAIRHRECRPAHHPAAWASPAS